VHARLPKLSTDGQYISSVWSKFLRPPLGPGGLPERIIFAGLVIKRRGLFARKRQLLLTSSPRLFYVDPEKMEMKKEIQWTDALWAEVADPTTFWIHTVSSAAGAEGKRKAAHTWMHTHAHRCFMHVCLPVCAAARPGLLHERPVFHLLLLGA